MKQLLAVDEVARLLVVSESAIYRALREGRLPGQKILGCWRVDPDELAEWVTSHRSVPRARPRESANEASSFLDEVRMLRDEGMRS